MPSVACRCYTSAIRSSMKLPITHSTNRFNASGNRSLLPLWPCCPARENKRSRAVGPSFWKRLDAFMPVIRRSTSWWPTTREANGNSASSNTNVCKKTCQSRSSSARPPRSSRWLTARSWSQDQSAWKCSRDELPPSSSIARLGRCTSWGSCSSRSNFSRCRI